MNKDEALKMAIETLELLNEHVYRTGNAYDAINACKEALEIQEPLSDGAIGKILDKLDIGLFFLGGVTPLEK